MTPSLVRCCTPAIALLLTLSGCSEIFGPGTTTVPDGELTIIAVRSDAPALEALEVSFWAKKGEDREVQIRYEYANGTTAKCLRFIVPSDALSRAPNGRHLVTGDSVEIKIQVLDPHLFLFEFNPGRLQFDPKNPARMEVRYTYASLDLNGNGIEGDPEDLAIRERFGLWKQERPGGIWARIGSRRDEDRMELYADINGFTRYALAAD
ncbi:MAG TPA: hypothetical protein VMN39_09180 [Longimicrobiaceae bacterium]|nr:hypothetical protein [Longimicrobiaceae bacterium]